jgi:putative toxin-antitoxin system antitoxin component (TIGR02293 family)
MEQAPASLTYETPEYRGMLGVSEASAPPLHPSHVERAILEGLSSDVLRNVARAVSPDPIEATRLVHAIVPKSSLSRRGRLTPAQGEQTERLARLFTYATRVFGNIADARTFMYRPHPELEGRRPVDACLTELGGRMVENVLDSLAFGLPV